MLSKWTQLVEPRCDCQRLMIAAHAACAPRMISVSGAESWSTTFRAWANAASNRCMSERSSSVTGWVVGDAIASCTVARKASGATASPSSAMSFTDGAKKKSGRTSVFPESDFGSYSSSVRRARLERNSLAAWIRSSPEGEYLSVRMAIVVKVYGISTRTACLGRSPE
jgi:hypothetical protein